MPKIVEHISLVIGVIGVSVILWGVLLGVLRLVRPTATDSASFLLTWLSDMAILRDEQKLLD